MILEKVKKPGNMNAFIYSGSKKKRKKINRGK